MIFIIALTGCFRINHRTYLELKDGSDILLYQRDSAWVKIWGSMKEWNNYMIDNNNWLNDSNYVRLELRVNKIDSIRVNSFFVELCQMLNNHSSQINEGKIYYDSESYHLFNNMIDTLKDFKFVNPSYGFGTLLTVQSKPSIEIEQADSFVVEVFLDCVIDGEEKIIHRVDTLFRNKKTRTGFSVH